MTYRISRDGQQYGPYTDAEVRQYIGTGHILLTDLVQPEGATEWALVGAVFASYIAQTYVVPDRPAQNRPTQERPAQPLQPPATASAAYTSVSAYPMAAPAALFPDPPDLPWWVALILGIVTAGFFFVVWDIVEASWLRRVERGSSALLLYIAVAVLYLIRLPGSWATVRYNLGGDTTAYYSHAPGLALAALVLILVARFVFRRELLVHFNGPEPLHLHLNWFWTLLFGGLYFQYKFNRINRRKRELQVSIPS